VDVTTTQNAAIAAELRRGRSITPIEALERHNCFRLAARIFDLRQAGWHIHTGWQSDGHKRWAEYRLIKGPTPG
jgi:hypothetical protein